MERPGALVEHDPHVLSPFVDFLPGGGCALWG
jgi:hypothetical protein